MDFEFKGRMSKFEKEQQSRREAAKLKRAAELAAQKEQKERDARREAELRERAAKKAQEQEELELRRAEEQRITGGITFNVTLTPYPIDAEDDRVLLPQSCLETLTSQDAFGHGPLTFRLIDAATGRITHCGVREFTAPESTIGLPTKVLQSLFDEDVQHPVSVKYVVLPKAKYVKIQPKHNLFSQVGPIKLVLEENLRHHCALSVGDVVTVWHRGKAHVLSILEMQPEQYGSLFETDVEVDLDVSEEYQQLEPSVCGTSPATLASPSPPLSAPVQKSSVHLEDEPSADDASAVQCRFKLPTGVTADRRFSSDAQLLQLFTFLRSHAEISAERHIQLVARMPHRKYVETDDLQRKLSECGVVAKQEMFLVSYA